MKTIRIEIINSGIELKWHMNVSLYQWLHTRIIQSRHSTYTEFYLDLCNANLFETIKK